MSYNGSNEENSTCGNSVKDNEGCQGEGKNKFPWPKYKVQIVVEWWIRKLVMGTQ